MNKGKIIFLCVLIMTVFTACGSNDAQGSSNKDADTPAVIEYEEVLTDRNGVEVMEYNVPIGWTQEDYPAVFGVQFVKYNNCIDYMTEFIYMYASDYYAYEEVYNSDDVYEWKSDETLYKTFYKEGEIDTPYGTCKIYFDDETEDYVSDFQVGLIKKDNNYVIIELSVGVTNKADKEYYDYFVYMIETIFGAKQEEVKISNGYEQFFLDGKGEKIFGFNLPEGQQLVEIVDYTGLSNNAVKMNNITMVEMGACEFARFLAGVDTDGTTYQVTEKNTVDTVYGKATVYEVIIGNTYYEYAVLNINGHYIQIRYEAGADGYTGKLEELISKELF